MSVYVNPNLDDSFTFYWENWVCGLKIDSIIYVFDLLLPWRFLNYVTVLVSMYSVSVVLDYILLLVVWRVPAALDLDALENTKNIKESNCSTV